VFEMLFDLMFNS